jgi:L-amino acid N-acyltransferase YncA
MREAKISDLEGIMDLYHAVIRDTPDNLYFSKESDATKDIIREKINYEKNGVSLVYEKDNKIIAFACGKKADDFRYQYIINNCTLLVHPEHQDVMCGVSMAREFFNRCYKRGFRYIWIAYYSINNKSAKMFKLFTRLGYNATKMTIPDGMCLSNGGTSDLNYVVFLLKDLQI